MESGYFRVLCGGTNCCNFGRCVLCVVILGWICSGQLVASTSAPTRDELLQTVKHIQSLADQTSQELAAEQNANNQLKSALAAAQQATTDTQNQFDSYQKAAESEIQAGNKAISSLAALVKKHHLDLIILCGLWVGLVGLLYLKAGTMLGPAGVYVGAGLAVAGTLFILWRL